MVLKIKKLLSKKIYLSKSIFLKTFAWLFVPILGFFIFSVFTYPLKPHCSLGSGILGCTPICEPISYFKDGRPAEYKITPCYHDKPVGYQEALFKNWFLIPLFLFIFFSLLIYKEGGKKVFERLKYIALAPVYLFRENRRNKNLFSRLVVLIMLFFLFTEWALGYYVVGATILGKEPFGFPSSPEPNQATKNLPSFTGQDVFNAVNSYRKKNNVSELKLDEKLCNNLRQRYLDIKKGEEEDVAHKRFDEWYQKYIKPYGYTVSENYACGHTPEDLIRAWDGSPGHRLSILDKKNKVACTYAAEGCAVIILGYKNTSQIKGAKTSLDDPIVNCQINAECGGGSIQMRSSECDQMVCCLIDDKCGGGGKFITKEECEQSTCCEIGGKWYFYLSKERCIEDQKNNQNNLRQPKNDASDDEASYDQSLEQAKIEAKLKILDYNRKLHECESLCLDKYMPERQAAEFISDKTGRELKRAEAEMKISSCKADCVESIEISP